MMNTIYVISGPAGVGKSTTSQQLVKSLNRSAYISGDEISHIPVNGREKPWLSKETVTLTWKNINSITRNLLEFKFDVVIDYVTFPEGIQLLVDEFSNDEIHIVYVVLMVKVEELVTRDQSRPKEAQMGERSVVLHREFEELVKSKKHILHTDRRKVEDIEEVIALIKSAPAFKIR